MQAMWLMLQQAQPDDYVIATGETHSVREFVEMAFQYVGRTIKWQGEGVNETGQDAQTSQVLVRINPKFFRPTEVVRYLKCREMKDKFYNILYIIYIIILYIIILIYNCFFPIRQDVLLGDASKARNKFGWKPTVTFKVIFCTSKKCK